MIDPSPEPLGIFVSYASGCLTDHESHGDGLVCFSLLDGLARRGHRVFAYTPHAAIRDAHPNLQTRVSGHRSPADSLAGWEHSWRAGRWLRELGRTERIDLVWRMHPFGEGCPIRPPTGGRPLVIGPLNRGWPVGTVAPAGIGRPRFKVGIAQYLRPLARRGWERSLRSAAVILCETPVYQREMAAKYPNASVVLTPIIVDPPLVAADNRRVNWTGVGPFRLVFVANLQPGKNAGIFREMVGELRRRGLDVQGTIIGDGVQRPDLERQIVADGLGDSIQMLGKLPNPVVFDHLRNSHLLVSASVGEPYGRGIAEAMAVGTPAVCHRSGGPAEFLADGIDGLLVGELTAAAYVDAVAPLIADPSRWATLAREAVTTAAGWRSEVVLGRVEAALIDLCRNRIA